MAEQQQEASTSPSAPSPSRRGVLKAAAVVGLGNAMTVGRAIGGVAELVVTGGGRRGGLGERLPVPDDAPVDVTVTVGGAPGTYVQILTDEGQMIRQDPDGGGAIRWRTTPRQAAYVRTEVRRTADIGVRGLPFGSMVAMTNPVFLGRGHGAGIGQVIT